MVVFGLILLLVALAVIAYMWFATRGMDPIQITYGVLNVDLTPIWLFFVGGITLAAATCGIWLLAVGTRSKARKAKEVRSLRRQAQSSGSSNGQGAATTSRGTGTTSRGTGTGTTTGRSTQGSDAPILPRSGSNSGKTGTTGQSSLDLDR